MSQLLRPPEYIVNDNDPWKNDVLDRQSTAEYLTTVISSVQQPFVVTLNSHYGTGKTVFLKCWEKHLSNQGYNSHYINIWETELSSDPLMAIISSLHERLQQNESRISDGAQKLKKWSKAAAPIIAKGLLRRALGSETFADLSEFLGNKTEEEIVERIGGKINDVIEKEKLAKKSMQEFRSRLSELTDVLPRQPEGTFSGLVVLVDELDRCRPSYAIEVLECIKHLFAVPNMLFIIAVDERQLQGAVKQQFGENWDTEGYLRRFIDWSFRLPEPNRMQFCKFLSVHYGFQSLAAFRGQAKGFHDSLENFELWFGMFSELYQLTLREQRQCYTEINVVLRTLKLDCSPLAPPLAVAAVMRARAMSKLASAISDRGGAEKLANELDIIIQSKIPNFGEYFKGKKSKFESWFLSRIDANRLNSELAKNGQGHNRYLEQVLDNYHDLDHEISRGGGVSIMDVVFRRLERAGLVVD